MTPPMLEDTQPMSQPCTQEDRIRRIETYQAEIYAEIVGDRREPGLRQMVRESLSRTEQIPHLADEHRGYDGRLAELERERQERMANRQKWDARTWAIILIGVGTVTAWMKEIFWKRM